MKNDEPLTAPEVPLPRVRVPAEKQRALWVTPEVHLAVKMYARAKGLTVTEAAIYLVTVGFQYLLLHEAARKGDQPGMARALNHLKQAGQGVPPMEDILDALERYQK